MKIVFLAFILLLSACTTGNHVNSNTQLKENHGILICSIHTVEPGWGINILKKGDSIASGVINNLDSTWNIVLMSLEEGEYTYQYLFYPPVFEQLESAYFSIEAGTVNYIGDLYINTSKYPYSEPNISFYYLENEEEVLKRMATDYPDLINRYQYRYSKPLIFTDSIIKKLH